MKSAAAALLVFAFASAGSAVAVADLQPMVTDGFCSAAPTEIDRRIAAADNALSVTAAATAPIAILDTGVTLADDVPELSGRLVAPFDAATGGNDGSDVAGHGTEVAGIAAGAPGLVQGISPASPIMPVRIYNRGGESAPSWVAAGINWAVARGAAVINISSATPQADVSADEQVRLTRAIDDAYSKGVLVVASAGNDGTATPQVPGALPHVLTVGGSDLTGARATFSNFGPWIDLVSPAKSLSAPTSTAYCPSGYGVADGSSFAAPAVSGAAALVGALRPALTVDQRFDVLRASAHDVAPTGRDDETGFGLLDVGAAINAAVPKAEPSREVDDDPYYVRGPNAAGHPTLLMTARKVRLSGHVSPAKDPSDVYPVHLSKGDRLVVSAAGGGADSLLGLGLWRPTVGDFDVSNQNGKQEVVSSGGFARDPELKMKAVKGGIYYVSVEAPDVDTDDPDAVTPVVDSYKLLVTRTPAPTRKPVHKKAKKKPTKK